MRFKKRTMDCHQFHVLKAKMWRYVSLLLFTVGASRISRYVHYVVNKRQSVLDTHHCVYCENLLYVVAKERRNKL